MTPKITRRAIVIAKTSLSAVYSVVNFLTYFAGKLNKKIIKSPQSSKRHQVEGSSGAKKMPFCSP